MLNRITLARLVSIVGHPFTFIVWLITLPFWLRGDVRCLRIAAVVVLGALVPLALFMRRQHKTGRWQTVDASAPSDRPILYGVTFAILFPMSLYFLWVEQSSALARGGCVIGLMLGIGALLNRRIKLSGHMAFAAFSAVVLIRIHWAYSVPVILFLPVLAWSRLALMRHTMREVLGGLVAGAAIGAFWWWL